MILYTEHQLEEAWHCHCAELAYSNQESTVHVPFPTIEEFRLIYEETVQDIQDGYI